MIDELEKELDRLAAEIKSGNNNLYLDDIVSIYFDLIEEQKKAQEKFERDNQKGGMRTMDLIREMRYAENLEKLVGYLEVFEIWRNDSKSGDMDALIDGLINSHNILDSVRHYTPFEVDNEQGIGKA